MWRQILFISLLITLSDVWKGVQARYEQEPFEFNQAVNRIRRLDKNIDVSQQDADIEAAVKASLPEDTGIAKEVQPTSGQSTTTVVKPTTSDKGNKTSTDRVHGTAQHMKASDKKDILKGSDYVFMITVTACSIAGLVGIIMAGVCWIKLNRSAKAASNIEYPAYGVTGPNKERIPSPGDRKLAQSAQMYHYQHQKQQMIAMEKANGEMKHDASDDESEEENEEGDYTVYECPGLAPTGEMEVKNPLFSDDTPVTPSAGEDQKE